MDGSDEIFELTLMPFAFRSAVMLTALLPLSELIVSVCSPPLACSAPATSASKAWYQNVWLWVGVAATTVVVLFASGVFSGPKEDVGSSQSVSGGTNFEMEASMGGSTP